MPACLPACTPAICASPARRDAPPGVTPRPPRPPLAAALRHVPPRGSVAPSCLLHICRLPNIGKKRAANIVAAREEGGPFATPADLSRIGLSDKQSDKLCAAYAEAVAEGRLALAAAKARKSL